MPSFNFLKAKFFGNAASTAAGFAAGVAVAPVLEPGVQAIRNEAWSKFPDIPPDAYTLAEGVAQGQVDPGQAGTWAKEQGLGPAQFAALVNIANTGPALGLAYDAWRRGELSDAEFTTALNRTGMESEWYAAMRALKHPLLSPETIANAVQQGHVANDDILPPIVGGTLPLDIPLTQIDIDPLAEAAASGITKERLQVMANLSGLPPPQGELLQMWNRGVITETAVTAGIREGHTKTKWVEAVKAMRRRLLTPVEYVDAHLRGYITEQEMRDGTALHGLNQADTDILFKSHGRPITVHQIVTGEARGGTYDGPTDQIPTEFLDSLREGSIKPPFYNLDYANRFTYPSAFYFRLLQTTGVLSPEQAKQRYLELGWPPDLAEQVSQALKPTGGAKVNPWVARAQGYLFTAIHKNFSPGPEYEAKARAALTLIGIKQSDQDAILALYAAEGTLT